MGINFGTIQNNTALKLINLDGLMHAYFGTIQNNTALKHVYINRNSGLYFGTIQNNTALKLHVKIPDFL